MSRSRRAFFRIAVGAGSALIALIALELAVRWRVEGGFVPALASLVGASARGEIDREQSWYLPDPELGYRLNPAMPGIDPRGFRSEPIAVPKPAGTRR